MLIHRLTYSPSVGVDNGQLLLQSRIVIVRDHDEGDNINQAHEHAMFCLRARYGCYFTLDSHDKEMVQG